eukprot:TRINITY_DN759_c2_g1_i2.p1 TRINITY_DN759_c2_g1~~TRINITY_DN759_c2_g1_i2.p1  ORF type:complete len:694 (+),score=232.61 TRINITY_DN759_c2_g1_i2:91-2172(+)
MGRKRKKTTEEEEEEEEAFIPSEEFNLKEEDQQDHSITMEGGGEIEQEEREEEEEEEEKKTSKKRGRKKGSKNGEEGKKKYKNRYIKKGEEGYVRPKYTYIPKGTTRSTQLNSKSKLFLDSYFQFQEEKSILNQSSFWFIPSFSSASNNNKKHNNSDNNNNNGGSLSSNSRILSMQESLPYSPINSHSQPFRIIGGNGEEEGPFSLPLFNSTSFHSSLSLPSNSKGDDSNERNHHILNGGGPIWAMDWCPLPSSLSSLGLFLASSSHQSPDSVHRLNQTYSGNHLIQIWNLPFAGNETESDLCAKLWMGIVHDGGCVWDLKWCPFGYFKGDVNFPSRLGLLAAACANGCIKIYSIPINIQSSTNNSPLIVDMNPVFVHKSNSPVTRASWAVDGRPILVAGYGDGYIRIWDFTKEGSSKSDPRLGKDLPNIVDENNSMSVDVLPSIQFKAHSRDVNSITWSPHNPSFLMTASTDSYFRVWDIRSPFQPLYESMPGGGAITSGIWSTRMGPVAKSNGPLISFEDGSLRLGQLANKSKHVLPRLHEDEQSSCCIWDSDISDLGNCAAFCTSDGFLRTFSISVFRQRKPKKISLVPLRIRERDGEILISSPMKEDKEDGEDFETITKTDGTEERVRIFSNPLVGLHRVCWSHSVGSEKWVAVGGASGLIHILALSEDVLGYGPNAEPCNESKKKKKK